jgi:hypothetical protein
MSELLWDYTREEEKIILEYLAVPHDEPNMAILLISAAVGLLKPSPADPTTQPQEAARRRQLKKMKKNIEAVLSDFEECQNEDLLRHFGRDIVIRLKFFSTLLPGEKAKHGGVALRRNANLIDLVAYLARVWVSHRNEPPKCGYDVKLERVTGAFRDFVYVCTQPAGFTVSDSVLRRGIQKWQKSLKSLK